MCHHPGSLPGTPRLGKKQVLELERRNIFRAGSFWSGQLLRLNLLIGGKPLVDMCRHPKLANEKTTGTKCLATTLDGNVRTFGLLIFNMNTTQPLHFTFRFVRDFFG